MNLSKKEARIPTYLSVEVKQKIHEMKLKGIDIIDFSVGDPDINPPNYIIEELINEINNTKNHRYPSGESQGILEFREAVAKMYYKTYGVELCSHEEVISLIGSKEGAHYLCLSLIKPGDVVIVCDPAYTTYKYSAQLSGAEVYSVPLVKEHGYLPILDSIPDEILKRTRLFFINYPNNPTGSVATIGFYNKLINLAQKYNFIVCNDNAYGQLCYDEEKNLSLLQVPGAMDVAVEMNSISKTFNLCGWRVGMLVGNKDVVQKVLSVKRYTDAGIFMPIQRAAAKAMIAKSDYIENCKAIYCERRNKLVNGLKRLGYDVFYPKAGMFVWVKIPECKSSLEFCEELLIKTGIACNPGSGFGKCGEGFIRFAMVGSLDRIDEALKRMELLSQ